MHPHQQTFILSILRAAAAEPYGLVLRTTDVARTRAALYKVRAEAADPGLSSLQVRVSPFPDGNLVICHPRRQPPASAPDIGEPPD